MEKKTGEKNVIDMFRLDGRVALVTGAAGYLGGSISEALCEAGAHAILVDKNKTALKKRQNALKKKGYSVSDAAGDITNDKFLKRLMNSIKKDFGHLEVIINNAYSGKTGTLESAAIKDFEESYRISVTASFRIVQLAENLLKKGAILFKGSSSVINIASMYGSVSPDPSIYGSSGHNNPPFYGSAKGGLIQLTKYAAVHLAGSRIRVNAVSPGPFPNPSVMKKNKKLYKKLCEKNPLKRIGFTSELKGVVVFLASEASSYITGVNLPVDGGWTAW
jgi:NAD(P)-dependent dehydrogenase (short-subunit alcohol dehydrogenase family)